jgi:hypothetical protein
MKYHVVFPAEKKNVALGRAELTAKSLCELNGGEASTDNDYCYWVHLLAPNACLDTTKKFGVLMRSSNHGCRTGHFDALVQDTQSILARISGTCEPYWK